MKRLIILAAIAAVALSLDANPAGAQTACADRDDVIAALQMKYAEQPVGVGVSNNGKLVELLTAKDGMTWTIILTTPEGVSCFIASGDGWRQFEPRPLPGPGA